MKFPLPKPRPPGIMVDVALTESMLLVTVPLLYGTVLVLGAEDMVLLLALASTLELTEETLPVDTVRLLLLLLVEFDGTVDLVEEEAE